MTLLWVLIPFVVVPVVTLCVLLWIHDPHESARRWEQFQESMRDSNPST